jgi:hypothetical protein
MLSCCMRLAGWRCWRVVVSCALQMCIYDGSTLMHSIHPCRVSLRIFPLNQGYRVDEVSVQNRLNPDGEGGRVSWLRPGYSVDETVQHPALTWTTAGTYLSQLDETSKAHGFWCWCPQTSHHCTWSPSLYVEDLVDLNAVARES